jgi:hypothetical protein
MTLAILSLDQSARARPAFVSGQPSSDPFPNAAEAWFWTMAALAARRDGTARSRSGPNRPCDPDDVVKCLDMLYRRRRVDLLHARVLRIWGERGCPPSSDRAGDRCDWKIWNEAIDRLEWPLRVKGIVA